MKSQRKRGLNNGPKMMDESSRLNSVGDIGVALAEEAKKNWTAIISVSNVFIWNFFYLSSQ